MLHSEQSADFCRGVVCVAVEPERVGSCPFEFRARLAPREHIVVERHYALQSDGFFGFVPRRERGAAHIVGRTGERVVVDELEFHIALRVVYLGDFHEACERVFAPVPVDFEIADFDSGVVLNPEVAGFFLEENESRTVCVECEILHVGNQD